MNKLKKFFLSFKADELDSSLKKSKTVEEMQKGSMNKTPTEPTQPTEAGLEKSLTFILRQLIKEAEKKEAAAEAMRTRCKTCFKEILPFRKCGGHGGGSGGPGGPASTAEHTASAGDNKFLAPNLSKKVDSELTSIFDFIGGSGGSRFSEEDENFDAKIIEELIAQGLLMVNMDRQSKTLTIEFDPNELSEEQKIEVRKYLRAILQELNEFKKEHHISDECFEMVENGNRFSYHFTFRTLSLYDAFIQRLANNLVPMPKPQLQEENTKEKNHALTPLSIEPKPSNNSLLQDKIEINAFLDLAPTKDDGLKSPVLTPYKTNPFEY